jgi:hypothetical protein
MFSSLFNCHTVLNVFRISISWIYIIQILMSKKNYYKIFIKYLLFNLLFIYNNLYYLFIIIFIIYLLNIFNTYL